jgi:hypothetical protein
MRITSETFEALLKCPTKAHSIYHRVSTEIRAITQLVQDDEDAFCRNASAQLRSNVPAEQLYVGTPPLGAIKRRLFQMILDCTFVTDALEAQVHFYLKMVGGDDDQSRYVPFRFCSRDKISHSDKLLLAFDAFVFAQVVGATPSYGELIVGQQSRRVRVALTPLYPKIESFIDAAAASLESPTPPRPVLNRHCAECQFAPRCTSAAKDMDDLSLLSKMSLKERQKYHDKGIFTVTQLSHTFRYRKRASKPKHDHALKALAGRKNKVVITYLANRVFWLTLLIGVTGRLDSQKIGCLSTLTTIVSFGCGTSIAAPNEPIELGPSAASSLSGMRRASRITAASATAALRVCSVAPLVIIIEIPKNATGGPHFGCPPIPSQWANCWSSPVSANFVPITSPSWRTVTPGDTRGSQSKIYNLRTFYVSMTQTTSACG